MNTINLRSSVSGMLLSTVGLALFISGCGGEEGKPVSTPNVPAAVREKAGEVKEEEKEKVTEAKQEVKAKVEEVKQEVKAKTEEVKQEVKAKVEDAKKVVGEKVDAAKAAVKEVAKDAVKKN